MQKGSFIAMAQASKDKATSASAGVDPREVERFSKLAHDWWNEGGKFKPLHRFNPVRLGYIRDTLARHYQRDIEAEKPLDGLSILDIGCGGGILSEPLARLGANVTGIDPSRANIAIAKTHAAESGLEINYRVTTAEALVKQAESFDMVLAMEVIEHVPEPGAFLHACARLTKPGGLLLVATINRTFKALTLAIVGAEYVLRWLPRGTHHYDKLVTPEEIAHPLDDAGMELLELQGVVFNPLFMRWQLGTDLSVNYMALAKRPR
jgi:2-polyprenyl-6-hydroxyphenyl methylase/3-demethylubiquinone-9 3-methyltransferase